MRYADYVLAKSNEGLISAPTRTGVKSAQRQGVKSGRKPNQSAAQIEHAGKLMDNGESCQHGADSLSVGRSTLYSALAD